jgi:hypothetical protein
LAVTGFATENYSAPVHPDPKDSKWTAGWRCWNADGQLETDYNFIYSMFCHASASQPGIIIDQPRGTITIWQGGNHLHGSSIGTKKKKGPRRIANGHTSTSGMVITQKPLMLQYLKTHKDETLEAGRLDLIC